jgi:acyl carrier protein
MSPTEVAARVKKVVAKVLAVGESDIADDANFVFDLGADSAQSVALVAALEIEFGIKIDKAKALALESVEATIEFISATM